MKKNNGMHALFYAVLCAAMLFSCSSGDGGGGGDDTTPAYTVGGNVSGLSGTLTLRNNGADDLTIAQDGTFTFATAVADGSGYNINIQSRPSNQNCSVVNGSGAVSGANVTTVAITCANKVWTCPMSTADYIGIAGQYDAVFPQVAMDSTGRAIIAWAEYNGATQQIFRSEYRNGVWTDPTSTEDHLSLAGQNAYRPQVAMDDNGNAVIAWYQADGATNQIYKSEYRNGIWSKPSSTGDYISLGSSNGNAVYPGVAMANNGDTVIVWYQSDGATNQIYKSEYRNGIWSKPSSTADHISLTGQQAYYPQVAMANNGDAIIIWRQSDGVSSQIYASVYRNGIWTNPTYTVDHISIAGANAENFPQVAMNDNGNAIVSWMAWDGATHQIYKSEYREGVWTTPSSTTDHISFTGQGAFNPQVAMDNKGNAIITWYQWDGSNNLIYKSEYRNGVWTDPASLADHISIDGQDTELTTVAMDNNGNAIIAWWQYGTELQIYKSEYRNGTWTGASPLAENVSASGTDEDAYPRVAMDDNGNAIITWFQYDNSASKVYKCEYR